MWVRILAVLAAIFLFSLPCFAVESEINHRFSEMMDGIPGDVADLLPDGFFEGVDQAAEGLEETLELGFWGRLLGELFGTGLSEVAPTLLAIFAVVVASAIISLFKDAFRSEALSGAVSLATSAVLISLVVKAAVSHIEAVNIYLARLRELCLGMIPVMGAVLAAGGERRRGGGNSRRLYDGAWGHGGGGGAGVWRCRGHKPGAFGG